MVKLQFGTLDWVLGPSAIEKKKVFLLTTSMDQKQQGLILK